MVNRIRAAMLRGFLFLEEQRFVPPGFAFAQVIASTKKQKTPVVALLTWSGRGSNPCGVLLLVCCLSKAAQHEVTNRCLTSGPVWQAWD